MAAVFFFVGALLRFITCSLATCRSVRQRETIGRNVYCITQVCPHACMRTNRMGTHMKTLNVPVRVCVKETHSIIGCITKFLHNNDTDVVNYIVYEIQTNILKTAGCSSSYQYCTWSIPTMSRLLITLGPVACFLFPNVAVFLCCHRESRR